MVMYYYGRDAEGNKIIECDFCGRNPVDEEEALLGECRDPDWCGSCDMSTYGELFHVERGDCMEMGCLCRCHETEWDLVPYTSHRNYDWGFFDRQSEDGFRFLDLPNEIRRMVYVEVFRAYRYGNRNGFFRGKIETALLRTSHQIYEEASTIPLATNEMWFTCPETAHKFLYKKTSHAQHQLLKEIRLDICNVAELKCKEFQEVCNRLATLALDSLVVTVKGREAGENANLLGILVRQLGKIKKVKEFGLIIGAMSEGRCNESYIEGAVIEEMSSSERLSTSPSNAGTDGKEGTEDTDGQDSSGEDGNEDEENEDKRESEHEE
ncbi:MAG: hypothetical protein M1837_003114 [Sclerophora amabilis]|nr:MAG: hypothetical protein M1837_003114 [Sclerophora amabilis]